MLEILKKIKDMIKKNQNDKAIKYIDEILSKNKNAEEYMNDLINELK
jgi:hypothetical protein